MHDGPIHRSGLLHVFRFVVAGGGVEGSRVPGCSVHGSRLRRGLIVRNSCRNLGQEGGLVFF